jgi:hypothetical protein
MHSLSLFFSHGSVTFTASDIPPDRQANAVSRHRRQQRASRRSRGLDVATANRSATAGEDVSGRLRLYLRAAMSFSA